MMYTVLVIGDDPDAQLQAFHNFDQTGNDDEWVEDIELIDMYRRRYATSVDGYRTPEGMLVTADHPVVRAYHALDASFDAVFSHEPLPPPPGFTTAQFPPSHLYSFSEWIRRQYETRWILPAGASPDLQGLHKYGYVRCDEHGEIISIINRRNPLGRWDWWRLGTDTPGFFKLLRDQEPQCACVNRDAPTGYGDQVRRGHVDWSVMRLTPEQQADHRFAPNAGANPDERESFRHESELFCGVTSVILWDGVWIEPPDRPRGPFSTSPAAKEWVTQFWEIVDGLPGDTLLTVVTCKD